MTPRILEAAIACFCPLSEEKQLPKRPAASVSVQTLALGQVLASDVESCDGTLLISAGHRVTETLLERIRNFREATGIREPIYVEVS